MPGQIINPDTMPAVIHGEPVVSAFRHLPLYGRLDDTYTVITLDQGSTNGQRRYNVLHTRFAPALGRWSIDTGYAVEPGLSWNAAAARFTARITESAS